MPDFGAFVGIDVGKAELVVHILRGHRRVRARALEGLASAGSGGAGIAARQLCPRRVRHFAKARGRLHKTDRADAVTLAEYAAHFRARAGAGPGRWWRR